MRKLSFIVACVLCAGSLFGQAFKGQIPQSKAPELYPHHEEEYAFDKPVDASKWTKQQGGMHVSFGSEDKLYLRTEVPDAQSASWEETAWRGERVNTQIVVWSSDTITQMHFTAEDLKDNNGHTLSAKNITLYKVNYVLSNYPYGEANVIDCSPSPYKDVFLMPDRFEKMDAHITRFDVPGRTVRPVWVSVDIPAGQEPGVYNGTINVQSSKQQSTLNVKITVQSQTLPKPHDWKFRLDLWQNPWVVAWHYNLEPWSDEHKLLLKKHLKLYADAGGKYITTYAVHSPWSDNSYMIEGGMIDWIKSSNGTWKFDYSIFDQYVNLCMEGWHRQGHHDLYAHSMGKPFSIS